MTMKNRILLLVFATIIIATVKSDLLYRVELLNPQGFRVTVQNIPGLKAVSIIARIYPGTSSASIAEYQADLLLQSNDWWAYQNSSAPLNPNDTFLISFIQNIEGSDELVLQTEHYIVPATASRSVAVSVSV